MSTKTAAYGTTVTRTPSIASTAAPPYTADAARADVELAAGRASLSSAADHDDDAAPPAYTAGADFVPTLQLQIQTPGKPWLSLPLPPRPDPIPVFAVDAATGALDDAAGPAYTSLRPKRGSGNCVLVDATGRPRSTTAYRFGPNRPARVVLFDPLAAPEAHDDEKAEEEEEEEAGWDAFPLVPKGLLTRAVTLQTRLGGFEWRYASRAERRAAGAASLLVLDRVTRVFGAGGREEEPARRPVAHLVRNEELRSPGSGASTAGNGGRLLLDLRPWDGETKTDRAMVEVLAVTTAVSMLKKEVDRRRAQQIAIMMSGAGGGP